MPALERTICGYCRAQDQSRIVFCQIEQRGTTAFLTEVDCDFFSCPHRDACPIGQELGQYEKDAIAH